ncbi:hypothetical protein PIB30_115199, partial [Stylosanthes scabra]|nr:hypothetical protein [Stylosanthes scabra]
GSGERSAAAEVRVQVVEVAHLRSAVRQEPPVTVDRGDQRSRIEGVGGYDRVRAPAESRAAPSGSGRGGGWCCGGGGGGGGGCGGGRSSCDEEGA